LEGSGPHLLVDVPGVTFSSSIVVRLPPETLEQIQAANDIVDVIGSYFPLKRAGSVYKALCPFHQERTPSFTVNPQRQIFKCFGCGAGGSVFRFVMNYENLEFPAAVKKLAARAGIPIVAEQLSASDEARVSLRRRLLALHAEAAEFFHQQLLKKADADAARAYLKGRGIGSEIARSWKLGYAPDSFSQFGEFARQRGFTDEELVASGLVKLRNEENPRGEFYDRFRNRVMFPICNDTGEVIAFSGRILAADAKAAKYINSPETMLFTKGAVLFGLHRSKRALIDRHAAIVCEGQLDLITAFEAGIQNVIAPQGTAFTPRQAHVLKRYVDDVVLCFDADAAGEKAAERSLGALLEENLTVRVVELPPGEDPDSLIRTQGAEAFRSRVEAARDYFDFRIDRLLAQPDIGTARGRVHAIRTVAESIKLISDPVLRGVVTSRAASRLEVAPDELLKLARPAPVGRGARDARGREEPAVPRAEPIDATIRLIALVALRDERAREWICEQPEWENTLAPHPGGELVMAILRSDLHPDDAGSVAAFLTTLEAADEATVSGLLEEKLPPDPMRIAFDCWLDLERRRLRRKMDAIHARLRAPNLPEEDVLKFQKEILDLQKRVSDIARPFSPPL
jgi:DNA primase